MEVFEPFWLRFFGMGGWTCITVACVGIQHGWWRRGSLVVCDLLPPLFRLCRCCKGVGVRLWKSLKRFSFLFSAVDRLGAEAVHLDFDGFLTVFVF